MPARAVCSASEEQTIIAPAVERGKAQGLDLTGPLPTDTLMVRARDGEFDAVVAMYHDQGHIALKLLGMHQAVNVTLGLPIIRTSVAHGTAFDIAWKRLAETSSMIEALRVASHLVTGKAPEASAARSPERQSRPAAPDDDGGGAKSGPPTTRSHFRGCF